MLSIPKSVAHYPDPGDSIVGPYLVKAVVRVQMYNHVVTFFYAILIVHVELCPVQMVRSCIVRAMYSPRGLAAVMGCRLRGAQQADAVAKNGKLARRVQKNGPPPT